MAEEWLKNKQGVEMNIFQVDGLVRMERGPQVMQMTCTDDNLDDSMTHPHYKVGGRDAMGRLIQPDRHLASLKEKVAALKNVKASPARIEAAEAALEDFDVAMRVDAEEKVDGVAEGATMEIVDYRAKHRPFLWKIYTYQLTQTRFDRKLKQDVEDWRWIKVDEIEGKDDAMAAVRKLAKEMSK